MKTMDFDATKYNRFRRTFIPCFDELYSTAIHAIAYDRTTPLKVLDLGAGTGLFSGMVQKAFPNAELTLVDQLPDMLEHARALFQYMGKTPTIVVKDYRELDFTNTYDLIMSALSIHHLTDDEKQHLYHRIYQALNPNGMFLNLDEVLGETPEIEQRYRQHWVHEVQKRGAAAEQITSAHDHARQFDHPSPLSHHLTWLRGEGFQHVTCWYQNFSFAVVSGIRRAELPPTNQPVLETARLTLRPFQLSDAEEVQRLAGDRIVAANTLSIPHPYPDGAAEAWIQSLPEQFAQGKSAVYAITLRDSQVLCGSIGLGINPDFNLAELGYWVGSSYQNQGYCTEAATALMAYGFRDLKLNRIQATHFTDNPASGRVMEKIGMRYEGCRRQHTHKWGELKDIKLYALLKSDLE